jgi:hypothetical protein
MKPKISRIALFIALVFFVPFLTRAQESKWNGPSVDFSHGSLQVSPNGRYLQFEDGTPFFYLGDTAWELFHRLDEEEAENYLENRREKGFTVIQAVALAELDGLNTPNPYGETPLIENDPTQPNAAYWKHVDYIIEKAEEKGLFIGLLPTWGDKVDPKWGVGPEIFNPENAYAYGQWIGRRYKDHPNIIWIIGGDRLCGGDNYPVWDAMAKGIKSVDPNHLMTFHPQGGTKSSTCFHDADWLDFNMLQSGHSDKFISNYKRVHADYELLPVKPCMDGEPCYEDHPVSWDPKNGWFDAEDVRRAAYWALFAGAHGHTYGCHPIWQMLHEGQEPISAARHTWDEVLDLPGAWDMTHVRDLMLSRPYYNRIPDQSLIESGQGNYANHVAATRGDGYAMVYLPANREVTVNPAKLRADKLIGWWFNPRTGESEKIGEFPADEPHQFDTPVDGVDWVLVLDDASRNFPEPGNDYLNN